MQLIARVFHRVLKLCRKIVDLAGSEAITQVHLAEALQYWLKLALVRKEGPAYDLPIVEGVLITTSQFEPESAKQTFVIGTLSLVGIVRHVKGVLLISALAWQEGDKTDSVPAVDALEATLIPDITIIPVPTLNAFYDHLVGVMLV